MRTIVKMPKKIKADKGQRILAAVFITPWIIGFLIFNLFPILSTFYYSFTEFNLFNTPEWIGFDNYREMFHNSEFYLSLYNTLYYIIIGVGLQLVLALITALLLNMKIAGRAVYRTIFFLPSIMPSVAGSMLWVWILNPKYGIVNAVLKFLHLPQPLWLVTPAWTKPAVVLMALWGIGNIMIIYLAGLGDIPSTYYEAVEIDGGGIISKFRHVTWPLLTPITMFQVISGIIAGFNIFTQTYIIQSAAEDRSSLGGIGNSLLFYAVNIYQEGFSYLKFGYASALAWAMLIAVMVITLLILKSSKRWVYYEGK